MVFRVAAIVLAVWIGADLAVFDGKYTQAFKNVVFLLLHRII